MPPPFFLKNEVCHGLPTFLLELGRQMRSAYVKSFGHIFDPNGFRNMVLDIIPDGQDKRRQMLPTLNSLHPFRELQNHMILKVSN